MDDKVKKGGVKIRKEDQRIYKMNVQNTKDGFDKKIKINYLIILICEYLKYFSLHRKSFANFYLAILQVRLDYNRIKS